ncbi:MAG: phosphoketolase family protein, partial [Candidatus Dormibacteraeota bacterium]|nr:phosphoketolase family protein [Candidatus Dormibacteraeota bacterium]
GIRFLNPRRDGAVLPILHLNENKISGPTVLGRAADSSVLALLAAHGYAVTEVAGAEPGAVFEEFAGVLDTAHQRIREIQADARGRESSVASVPPWPAIVLRTPKGWTGPREVDGLRIEGTWRAHQVPITDVATNPGHLRLLEEWMLSYEPERLFDAAGRLVEPLRALAPEGDRRMGASPHANGGRLAKPLTLPDVRPYTLEVADPGRLSEENTQRLGQLLRDIFVQNSQEANFRLFCPDETNSNRLGAVFEVENRCLMEPTAPDDVSVSPDGRVMEVLSEHNCQGWLEGYTLSGRHGLFATYEAFAMVSASMAVQHTKWLEAARSLDWRLPVPSLNVLLTSTCWRNDHNGFSHQGPGLIDTMISMSGEVVRVYLPPDSNCLISIANHCFRSKDHVNLIVIDKQLHLQYLDFAAADEHCARGASAWEWASTSNEGEPDVVMACAGDVPTLEALAATALLREHVPQLRVRFVNVVDLMCLFPPSEHPHGLPDGAFASLFGERAEVVFAFHGYARALHQLLHGRPNDQRYHVHGFREQGTTTTPFDMVVLNEMSRYHLAMQALRRVDRPLPGSAHLIQYCNDMLQRHHRYVREHLEDMPEVRDWAWQ